MYESSDEENGEMHSVQESDEPEEEVQEEVSLVEDDDIDSDVEQDDVVREEVMPRRSTRDRNRPAWQRSGEYVFRQQSVQGILNVLDDLLSLYLFK